MSIAATMRALQQTSLNGPRDMRLITDAPVPSPAPGEVLIRVAAAGVNFADISKARGVFLDGPRPPYLAGFEAAGEVVAVGGAGGDVSGPTGPRVGDRVVGVGAGAFAEYMVLPAAAAVPVPAGWTEQRARALLDAYIAAFERSDANLLEQVLRTDATLEATPFRDWQSGRANCIQILDAYVLGTPGDWRMTATTANGQPAAAVYHRNADGPLRADGIVVLAPTATGILHVTKFHNPALTTTFGFPNTLAP